MNDTTPLNLLHLDEHLLVVDKPAGLLAHASRMAADVDVDLLDQLRPEVARAAPTQVYRALDFLIEHGFIHKLESINAYTGCHHPAERHTVPFFICDQCGAATEFCDSQVAAQLVAHAHALGFTPHAQTLEVHGICADCREAT